MTTPKKVTLFEDRAEVVREAKVALPVGRSVVSLSGVSIFVDDRSVQARLTHTEAKLLSARVKRSVSYEVSKKEELSRLEQEVLSRHQESEAARLSVERAQLFLLRQEEAFSLWCSELSRRFRSDEEATWDAAYQELQRSLEEAQQDVRHAEDEHYQASERLARSRALLIEGQRREQRYEVYLEVEVESSAAVEATLEVTYRAPCALWRPEHLARLQVDKADPRRGELEITTYATIWQLTGEVWSDVSLMLSTARPARQAAPPLLNDDMISLRRKTDDEKRNIYVEARDQSIVNSGVERGARATDEMPGVDDGGAPLQFSPAALVSLASDGRPLRVQIAQTKMPCVVSRVLYPERTGAAHLKAVAALHSASLLAGPVRLARGSGMVGRTRLPFVSTGDTLELGFGPDDAVRARRNQNDQRDTIPVIGTQKLKRTIEVFLSNMSGEMKELEVTERVPVSELEEIEIHTIEEGNFRIDKDGFAKQSVRLSPNETKQLKLVYEVRASSKVRMPF